MCYIGCPTLDQRLSEPELTRFTCDHEVSIVALEEVNEQEWIMATFVSDFPGYDTERFVLRHDSHRDLHH